ncbi:anti-sigma factor antagonist [Sphingomonas histidinilytica]|uniref:STAS domain-containing protein n=1 Tax=Rhizorhabdus histidinilytica TaxID=439228 RepID=UPI001ADAAF35|nr:STAS domain-containing protein [Rhizorhabdus histidinilytica]MBO9376396.1 anti-sigma factor antagonist [Rhizorhabdus histidinilytica]
MTEIDTDGDITVVTVDRDRFDAVAAPGLKADFQRLGPVRKLVLDLSRVSFMDSTGLGALVSLLKMLGGNGAMAVAGVQPPVRKLFEMTRLDSLFRLTPNVEEAKAFLNG